MYGADTWALNEAQEKKLDVAEMQMLQWMCEGTKLDRIGTEIIWETRKVRETGKKIQKRRCEMVWACDTNRGTLCGKKGDGNGSIREEERKA